jgi:hypothetical protein
MESKKRRLTKYFCVLLFAGAAAGLWAQSGADTIPQPVSYNRPLRNIRPDSHSPLSTPHSPLPTPHS